MRLWGGLASLCGLVLVVAAFFELALRRTPVAGLTDAGAWSGVAGLALLLGGGLAIQASSRLVMAQRARSERAVALFASSSWAVRRVQWLPLWVEGLLWAGLAAFLLLAGAGIAWSSPSLVESVVSLALALGGAAWLLWQLLRMARRVAQVRCEGGRLELTTRAGARASLAAGELVGVERAEELLAIGSTPVRALVLLARSGRRHTLVEPFTAPMGLLEQALRALITPEGAGEAARSAEVAADTADAERVADATDTAADAGTTRSP